MTAALYADRREVPAQRQFFTLPQLFTDPAQSAWAALRLAYNLAATHADRRLYPQQRLYFPLPLPPPPFTPGVLTARDVPGSAMTASDAAAAILTAVIQASGGPS
jgi:hypothetical protein